MTAATAWLDRKKPVEQMTWAPGLPMLIRGRLIAEGGWIERAGVTCFNLYRPPTIRPGNAAEAGKWLGHVHKVYPGDADHIIKWCAHRVQRPQEKINHGLVLGGAMGIGKDTLLAPVGQAIGPWNMQEVSPQHLTGQYNGFLKAVILRISEARDLGDSATRINRFQFYDHMKAYLAAPPDVLYVNEKYIKHHYVLNCCGIAITTNHLSDGIFLPADDRRHYVAWSELTKEDFTERYWNELWGWYDNGGHQHVAAYLAALDLTTFNAKAPPPKTPAFWAIVDSSRTPEDAELADVLDKMGNPDATTLIGITNVAGEGQTDEDRNSLHYWLSDRKNRRLVRHRLENVGYVAVHNPDAKDGLWKRNGSRQVIYARAELSIADQIKAVRNMPGVQRDEPALPLRR